MQTRRVANVGCTRAVLLVRLLPAVLLALVAGCRDGGTETGVGTDEEVAATTSTGDGGTEGAGGGSEADGDSGERASAGDGGSDESGDASDNPVGELVDIAQVAAVAEAADAEVIVARLDDETVVVRSEGRSVELAVPADTGIWSDGRFVYRSTGDRSTGDRSTGDRSTGDRARVGAIVSALDGTVVCEVEGLVHHVTERVDGTHVAAVESDFPDGWDGVGEYALPMEAVDCRTGERRPIESVTIYGQDGEFRYIDRRAGRVFTGYGDAEGNADVENEQGLSINGEDYAGYHTFSADASVVMYGDMTSSGPHLSPVVVARDTTTGAQLWRTEFDIAFRHLWFIGDRPAIGFLDDEMARIEFREGTDRLVLLDPATGERAEEIAVGFELLFIG